MRCSTQDDAFLAIKESNLTIYDSLESRPELKLSAQALEAVLDERLNGLLLNQPIRTRSKAVKSAICKAIGYPVPPSFRKTRPRFPGQDFDVYVQKSDNLQIWNEDLSPTRRYVLVRVSKDDTVVDVRVVNGVQLSKLDTTGTLTRKFQATAIDNVTATRLVSANDTPNLTRAIQEQSIGSFRNLLPIDKLFVKLRPLEGMLINNPGADQERNRGWELHQLVSKQLGIAEAKDDGLVPDITAQLLELKLQTSPTVDLGLVSPGSCDPLEVFPGLVMADIRYAIFYGTVVGKKVRLNYFVLTNGADFFCHFKRLEGNVVNRKNQIRLPEGFFKSTKVPQ